MRRMSVMLAGTALAASVVMLVSARAQAEPAGGVQLRTVQGNEMTDVSAQRRPRRVPIYPRYQGHWEPDVVPRYNPGPNAVRVCNAAYVPEHRPSGTVIVPHMSCYWRRG